MDISFWGFNMLEGAFWLACATIALYAGRQRISGISKKEWGFLALDFFIFGITDLIEANVQYSIFDRAGLWLLALKVACVFGIVVFLISYTRKRA